MNSVTRPRIQAVGHEQNVYLGIFDIPQLFDYYIHFVIYAIFYAGKNEVG